MATLPPDVRRILEEQGLIEPEGPDAGAEQALQDLREMGLLPKEEGFDPFQPIRTAFSATGSVGGSALGALAPEQYEAARKTLQESLGVTPDSPWYEQAEALPGLGDVAAEFVPQSVRDSRLGTALGPVGRIAGNIVGDPTTYTPFVMGRIAGATARSVPAAAELIGRAGEAELARRAGMAALAEGAIGPRIPAEAARAARLADAERISAAVLAQGSPLQRGLYRATGAIREAEPIASGAGAALAYGPAALSGALQGWGQVGEGITEQPLLDTGAEAVNAALQTGLSALMAAGLISATQAQIAWAKHLAAQRPADIEARVGQVGDVVAGAVGRLEQPPGVVGEPLPGLGEVEAPAVVEPGLPGFAPELGEPGTPRVIEPGVPEFAPELIEPGTPRLPEEEPGFAPELGEVPGLGEPGTPGLVEGPIPGELSVRPREVGEPIREPEAPPRQAVTERIQTAPEPRVTEEEIAPILETPPAEPISTAQQAEPIVEPRPEPAPEVPARVEPTPEPPPEGPVVPVEGAPPVGKVDVAGPVKEADTAPPAKPSDVEAEVDGMIKAADDRLARDPEVARLVRSVFGLGGRKRVSEKDLALQGQLSIMLKDPEARAALVKKLDDVEAAVRGEKKEWTPELVRKTVMGEVRKGAGEASQTRKVDAATIVEKAEAGAAMPVGKIEAPPKKIANHYDFIKDQIGRAGSELQKAGIKSVGELVDKLPLKERFKPHEIQAYKDYVSARDGGKTHAEAVEFVRSQQKDRWSSNQAAANAVNLILKAAREQELKKGTVAEVETGKREATTADLEELAREKRDIVAHLRDAIRDNNVDDVEASIGAWLAHVKKRGLFDLKRDYTFLKDLKKLADDVNGDERFTGPKVSDAARKNAEALGEAIARRVGIEVKAAGKVAKTKLAEEGKRRLGEVQAARAAEEEAGPGEAPAPPIKRPAPAKGAIPTGPGGFETMRTVASVPYPRYRGRNGLIVSFIRNEGILRVEKVPEGVDLGALKEDFAALREDPDIKVIDLSDEVPLKALDGILSMEEGRLPAFIEDPDPPRGIDRLIRSDARQDRIAEMAAREIDGGVSPSWLQPRRAWDPAVQAAAWRNHADDLLDEKAGVILDINQQLQKLGGKGLDLNNPVRVIGEGRWHRVYELVGAEDKDGNQLVLRVGPLPFFKLTEAQEALHVPVIADGKLGTNPNNAEPLYYTVNKGALAGPEILEWIPLGYYDVGRRLSGMAEQFQPGTPTKDFSLQAFEDIENEIILKRQLPDGISLLEFLADSALLAEKGILHGTPAAYDMFGPHKVFRSGQVGYVPVTALDTRGVGRVANNQAWQLVALDRALFQPKTDVAPFKDQIHDSNRIALAASEPVSRLTLDEQMRQILHYDEDSRDAEVLDGGIWNANHDRVASAGFVDRHGELGGGAARGLKGIVEDLVARINDQHDVPAEGKLLVEYRGLTSSPFLSGLYHERQGGGVGEPAHIYSNVVEAVAAGKDYDAAIDNMLHTVVHEVVHNKSKGHGSQFQTIEEYVKNLLEAQGQMDAYRAQLKEAFPEEAYRQVQDQLVPEYSRMRRAHGNRTGSWRDRPVEGVPARAAEGRAETLPDRRGGGEEAAAGDLAVGVQPRGDVPGGGRGQTGELRPATATGELAAARPAEGEAARSAAGGDPLQEIKARISEYGARVTDEQKAKDLLHQMVGSITKLTGEPPTHDEMHEWGWALAGQLTDVMHVRDLEQRANSLPSPTKSGQVVGPINMLHYVDLPVKTKARIQIWGELTKGLWPKDVPQRWEDVSREVQQMLGLHTPEEWAYHFREQGGGVSARDLLIMRQVVDELQNKVIRAEEQLYDTMARPDATPGEIESLQQALNLANRSAIEGGLMMAGGGTKAGRALAILGKDIRRMNPQLAFEQNLLAGLRERTQTRFKGDKAKAEQVARELFAEFMRVRDSNGDWGEFAKAYRAMLGSKLWPDKILEFYKAGLLGWPSRVANMTSNALLRGVRMVEDAVAAGLDATQSKLTGKERELFLGEASVSTMALRRAWSEAIPEWIQEMKRNVLLKPDDFTKSLQKGSMMEDLLQHGGAIEGKKGEFLRFHLKGMGADDALAKHFVRTDNLYRQIYRRVRKAEKGFERRGGETHAQATERIFSDLRGNWQKAIEGAPQYDFAKLRTFEPMLNEAEKAARRETFQEELNNLGKSGQAVLRDHPFLQIFIPFFRTPWNITKETIARSPVGFLSVAKKWNEMTPAERMSELSRPATGSLLGMGAIAYAMSGGASGGGPIDPDERAMLESTGWQPYSVKLGDQYISYQRLEPLAAILGVAADAAEGLRNGDFQSARTGFLRVMQSAAENVTNKTFLSGLDALSSAISHPNQFGNSFIKRMQSSVIPNSLGFVPVSGLTRALDQTYRQTDAMTMSAFYAKLPFLSSTLEPQYSPSGAERQRPGSPLEQIISPFARVKLEGGPAQLGAEEVVRLSASPKAPRRYWVAPGGLRVDFKPEERKAMAQAMQAATKHIGERVIKDPTYLALPENEMDPRFRFGGKTKETVIKNIYGRYRDQVMQRIKPQLAQRARKQLSERERG